MKIEYLRQFCLLADCLNFSQAAEKLFITQPALSRHISAMEDELGVVLMNRTTKSVELTREGKVLRSSLTDFLAQYDRIVNQLQPVSKRSLRIGLPAVPVNDYLGNIPTVFRQEHPNVNLSYSFYDPEDSISSLFDGESDLIMISHIPFPNYEQLTFFDYAEEPMTVMMSEKDMLATEQEVTLTQLEDYTFLCIDSMYYYTIWEHLKMACQWSGFTPKPPMLFSQMSALLAAVREGLGVAVVGSHHRTLATQRISCVKLADKNCSRKMSLAYLSSNLNPSISQFIDVFMSNCQTTTFLV